MKTKIVVIAVLLVLFFAKGISTVYTAEASTTFDSGWFWLAAGQEMNVQHQLGGAPTSVLFEVAVNVIPLSTTIRCTDCLFPVTLYFEVPGLHIVYYDASVITIRNDGRDGRYVHLLLSR